MGRPAKSANWFEVEGGLCYICWSSPKYGVFRSLIDEESMITLENLTATWHVHIDTRAIKEGRKPLNYFRASNEYSSIKFGETQHVYLHRFLANNLDRNLDTDHINSNTLDNRRCNLRNITAKENRQHKIKPLITSKTGLLNIVFGERGGYRAKIVHDGVRYTRRTKTLEEAIEWRDAKRRELGLHAVS